ncbi:MAG: AAA family ATPase [Candidatus Micrarchaeaceae archaeon]
MINSIELRNWKTHKDTKLDFSKGINILIGQMGSGKSSIMDAISFALFGTFPALQHKRVNVSKLIRNKPEQQADGYVKLTFGVGADTYSIKREIALSGKSTAKIEKNGSYLQSQPERVTEEAERILKVDYDLFSKAVYSEQNQLNYFLDLRSSERKKQIDGLLGLDKFAMAQDNSTTLSNRIKDMISDTARMAKEFDLEKARHELGLMRSDLDSLRNERDEAELKIKQHTAGKAKLEADMNRLKEQNSRKIYLAKEMEGLKSRINLLESEITSTGSKGLQSRDDAENAKRELQLRMDKLKDDERGNAEAERKHQAERARLDADINNAKKDSIENQKIIKELGDIKKAGTEKKLSECTESLERLNTEIAHLKSIISDTAIQAKELEGHMSKCPICERELDEATAAKILKTKARTINEHTEKVKALEAALLKRRSEFKELNTRSNSATLMEERLKAYSGIDERLRSSESALSKAKAEYEKAKGAGDAIRKELNSLSEEMQKINIAIEAIARMERHISEKAKLSKGLSEKAEEYAGIAVDEGLIDKLQAELVNANSEISKHSANLSSANKFIKDKEGQVKEKESDIEKISRLQDDLKKKKSLVDNISKFKSALAETQAVMRTQLINSINDIMQNVWSELYPYGDYKSILLDVADDDYSLKVKTLVNNEYVWEDVEAIASGGERSTACLAMRIAFSLVLVPNLKWLILDEPTHNIDDEGLSKFVQMFSERMPGIIDQVFIITHDDILKQVSNARIYQLARNKEEDKETEISEV